MATLWVLGAGTPTPSPERFGTAMVLQTDQSLLMIDCGPAATASLVRAGLWPTSIDYLFITHHHFDHTADYPCFLLCRWDQSTGRENRLRVWGPEPTRLVTERLVGPEGAFSFDLRARVGAPTSQAVHSNRGGSLPRPELKVEVTDIGPGFTLAEADWRISAAGACHVQPWLASVCYRVDTPGGSITFAGDTEPCPSVAALAAGSDVLVANCWDHQEAMEANGEHVGQTGTLDAGNMARDAGARMLVLAHMGQRLATPEGLKRALGDIGSVYDGQVVVGRQLGPVELW